MGKPLDHECVKDAHRLNILEINQMRTKIERTQNEMEFLNKRISELKEMNEVLGVKQEELAKQHTNFVLWLNQTLEERAAAIIYINDTYAKIKLEKEEIAFQKQCLQETNDLIDKHKTEYLEKKEDLTNQIKEIKQSCETSRKEAYSKKKELTRLQNKIIRMKHTVNSSTLMINDHTLEMARLQESVSIWEKKVEDLKKSCLNLEDKLLFFRNHKERLNATCTNQKNIFLTKIQQVVEKLQKAQLENRDLRERLLELVNQYKIVAEDENKASVEKQKIYDENQKQITLINQKETFLAQRKLDIKNMEEGYDTLRDLLEATKEVYRNQIRIMNDNLERKSQRSVVTQWKITCLKKRHIRWLTKARATLRRILNKIEMTEAKRAQLLEETKSREQEIYEFVGEIDQLKLELEEDEKEFVKQEKKLIQELNKYEVLIKKETQTNKEREEQLVDSLPQLQTAEEQFTENNRDLKDLINDISAKKQEVRLLNNYIFRFRKDITRYEENMDSVKSELQHLRKVESKKLEEHFEFLKNLENDIYVHDQKASLLILENKKLKEFLEYLKKQIQMYREKQHKTVENSSDLSWQLIAQHKHYGDFLAKFQTTIKEMVNNGEDILQDMTSLIEKLQYRDEKIEAISAWLLGSIERLRLLVVEESNSEHLHIQYLETSDQKKGKKKIHFASAIKARRNALTGNSKQPRGNNLKEKT
ncbi:coiled-coil domain-containing protein 175 isoform X1 [Cricetulus griseus]|uniref:coiled-coil domain-containing protein 175 isoform X1 n=1 Tax=Cricetulus griseus TaxID=10029 RepID=UPI00045431F2|nr:coiled-coil domain-containing protein 175 isoform X1 [Cricetulus griseus]